MNQKTNTRTPKPRCGSCGYSMRVLSARAGSGGSRHITTGLHVCLDCQSVTVPAGWTIATRSS